MHYLFHVLISALVVLVGLFAFGWLASGPLAGKI